jgi:hypothetical protein
VLNSNNQGRLTLNVDPTTVDANKTDRIGLVAQLTDSQGTPIVGIVITFSSDVDDIRFIPDSGTAVTNAQGLADVIAVAGSSPTGTGAIIGTAAIFAEPPQAFGLRAQAELTLHDVGFIDADVLSVFPSMLELASGFPGQALFFSIAGGTPPYHLTNETSPIGNGSLGQHCLPGCTESDGVLCIGSPCQMDEDCNELASPTPANVCAGAIKRCLASCAGTNCAGARCNADTDCNDGAPAPANVCKDAGQAISYVVAVGCGNGVVDKNLPPRHSFQVNDSAGGSVEVQIEASFVEEECDGNDLEGATCVSQGFTGGTLRCDNDCEFDTSQCTSTSPTPAP